MVITSERARSTLDARDDTPSGALPSRSSGDSNVTTSGRLALATSPLLSNGTSAAAKLRPVLSGSRLPASTGVVSPTVAAMGFWISGGAGVYLRYGPHAKELDPLLKMVLSLLAACGLLTTSVLLWYICTMDRALLRTFKQRNEYAVGGTAGIICCLLLTSLPREMFMTVLIPESLGFMGQLVPETYPIELLSGLLISVCRLGMMTGCLVAYPLTSGRWNQPRLKRVVVGCGAAQIAALLVFVTTCYQASRQELQEVLSRAQDARLVTLFSCQYIAGTAQGVINAASMLMMSRVSPTSSRPTIFICRMVIISIGTGLGPMLSEVVRSWLGMEYPPSSADVCAVNSLVIAVLSGLWLASFVLFVPGSNDGMPVPFGAVRGPTSEVQLGLRLNVDHELDEEAAQKLAAQKKLFIYHLTLQTERAWLVAGFEVVTAMIMEQEYDISPKDVGLAVGSTFLIAAPLMVIGAHLQQHVRPETLLICFSSIVAALCVLIFRFPAEILQLNHTGCISLLLGVGTLVYPAAQILGGMIQGLAFAHAIIPGSRTYSLAVAVIAGEMLVQGVGRFMSMPISRLIVASSGHDAYAAVQLGLACMSLLSCIKLAPALRLLVPSASTVNALSRPPSRQASSRQASEPPSPKLPPSPPPKLPPSP